MPNQRLITYNGKTQSVSAWGRELGIPHVRIFDRLRIGWSFERAISEPLNKKYQMTDTCTYEGCTEKPTRRNLCRRHYNQEWMRSKGANYKRWYNELPVSIRVYYSAKNRAKKANIPFTISPEDVIVPDVCPVLGIPLKKEKGPAEANSPSLDRIDPTKGYVPGNVCVISMKANTMKSNGCLEEAIQVANYIMRMRGPSKKQETPE